MNASDFQKLETTISGYTDDVIKIQTDLTAINSLGPENGGEGEVKEAEYIKKLLKTIQYDSIEEVNAPDDRVPDGYRPNLLVKLNGESNKKTIWIMVHMDIVPPGDLELWNTDPFVVQEKDGVLYGRGVEDNQQGFVSVFLALKAMREHDILPAYDVGLAIVADEEMGSKYGIEYVLENRKDAFGSDDLIIIPDAGEVDGTMIEVAEKSLLWIKCETTGKQTHGSTPEKGINAHNAAAHFVVKMNELYKVYDRNDPLYDPPISTFEPTKKENNVPNINTIPADDVVYFDCRILPEYDVKTVQKQIRQWADEIEKQFGVTMHFSFPQIVIAPPPTSTDAPVVVALRKAIKEVMDKDAKTMGIGGGTVAASFREVGLPAVCWSTIDDTAHEPNESCTIANVLNDAKVFTHIFLQD